MSGVKYSHRGQNAPEVIILEQLVGTKEFLVDAILVGVLLCYLQNHVSAEIVLCEDNFIL